VRDERQRVSSSEGGNNFFKKYSINADTHTYVSIHLYEYTHTHPTRMTTFKRLSRLDLEIHEVGYQERLTVNRDVASN
jgi:hypothetical protein